MSAEPPRFAAAALLEGGFLKRRCTEAVHWTCADCGGPHADDSEPCGTCFSATAPVRVCATCLERVATLSGTEARPCLSVQAYERDPRRGPIFGRSDEVLWGRQCRAGVAAISDSELKRQLAAGDLARTTPVSRDCGSSFSPAHTVPELRDAVQRAPGTPRFALDQVWRTIAAVPHPTEPIVPDIAGVRVTPVPVHVDKSALAADLEAERARRAAACDAARHVYEQAVKRSKQGWNDQRHRVGERQQQLGRLRDEYVALPEHEKKESARAVQLEHGRQRFSFLSGCRIETADIPGVGAQKAAALRAHGVRTAADVNESRVDHVPGFGPELTAAVVRWRRHCETLFVFDRNLARAAEAEVRRACAGRRHELETALVSGAEELQRLSQDIRDVQGQVAAALAEASRTLAQAMADLGEVEALIPEPRGLVPMFVYWLTVAIVALALGVGIWLVWGGVG